MNTRAIQAIVRKDLKVAVQNKGVLLPMIILPLILFVVIPWVMAYVPSLANGAGTSLSNMDELLARMPAGLLDELSGYTTSQQMIVFALVYMLAPMFLIMPLMVSAILAADSFAGEKERKTLEALLYTPTTDRELFTAKLLGAWVTAIVVALLSFVVYAVLAQHRTSLLPHLDVDRAGALGHAGRRRVGVGRHGVCLRTRPGVSGCLSNRWTDRPARDPSHGWTNFRRDVLQRWRCLAGRPGDLVDRRGFALVCQQRLSPRRADHEVLNLDLFFLD